MKSLEDHYRDTILQAVDSVLTRHGLYISEPATGYRNPFPDVTYPVILLRQPSPTPHKVLNNFIFNDSKIIDSERSFFNDSLIEKFNHLSDDELFYLYQHHRGQSIHKVLHHYTLVERYISHTKMIDLINISNLNTNYDWITNDHEGYSRKNARQLTYELFKKLSFSPNFKGQHELLKDFLTEHGYANLSHVIFHDKKNIYQESQSSIAFNFQINLLDLPLSSQNVPHETDSIEDFFKIYIEKIESNFYLYSHAATMSEKIEKIYPQVSKINRLRSSTVNVTIVSQDEIYAQSFMKSLMELFCQKISSLDKLEKNNAHQSMQEFLNLFENTANIYNILSHRKSLEKQLTNKSEPIIKKKI